MTDIQIDDCLLAFYKTLPQSVKRQKLLCSDLKTSQAAGADSWQRLRNYVAMSLMEQKFRHPLASSLHLSDSVVSFVSSAELVRECSDWQT